MSIYLEPDSILFGNQASRDFAAPIYPEYSIDWVVRELDEFEQRSGDVFRIDEQTKADIRGIAPYWHGHTHERCTGSANGRILDNLRLLARLQKRIIIRLVIVPGYNDGLDDVAARLDLIRSLGSAVERVDVLPYHGQNKLKR